MTSSNKTQTFDCIQYLINECQAKVTIEYNEITVYHPKVDHIHARIDENVSMLDVLRDIIMMIEKDEC